MLTERFNENRPSRPLVSITCDICKAVSEGDCDRERDEWNDGKTVVAVKMEADGESMFLHVCPDCFRSKVMPLAG